MYKVKEKQGLALACNIEYPNSDKRSSFAAGDPVLATGLLTPCRRNVWTLIPEDKSLKGKELRFGEMFHIQLVGSEEPLYVHAPAYKPGIKTGESTHIVPKLLPWTNDLTRYNEALKILFKILA